MSLQNWPIITVAVKDLALDLANVRIRVPQASEEAVMNYLYLYDNVDSLAHDFLRDGYLDNELPVVVAGHKPGTYVVLEGNRRVGALKGLLHPEIVPAKTAQLERLIKRYAEAEVPDEIRVMVAPNAEVVQPLLARLHTQIPKKGWPRDQQAAFYFAQIEAGASAESLRKLYSTQPGQISKFLKMATLLRAVRAMKIEDQDLREYVQGDKLSITAFEYAYLRVQVQAILKLDFDGDGILQQKALTEPQRKGLVFILGLIKADKLNTRTANLRAGTEENSNFLEALQVAMGIAKPAPAPAPPGADPTDAGSGSGDSAGGAGSGTGTGTGGSASGAGGAGGDASGASGDASAGKGSRGPNSPSTQKYLDLGDLDYAALPQGLKRRFIELRKMDVQELPNASFDVLRTVLECSIRVYCDAVGQPVPAGNQLGGCLTHLIKQFPDKTDRSVRNIINALMNGKTEGSAEYFRSAEALNSANHDPNLFVEGGHVHWAWEHMKPLLKRLAKPVKP